MEIIKRAHFFRIVLFAALLCTTVGTSYGELKRFFLVQLANGKKVLVLGESHGVRSIEEFKAVVSEPEKNAYLLELPKGTSDKDINKEAGLLHYLYGTFPDHCTLIDFSIDEGFLDLFFTFRSFCDEDFDEKNAEEFFNKIKDFSLKESAAKIPFAYHRLAGILERCSKLANENKSAEAFTLLKRIAATDFKSLSLALRFIPAGMAARDENFAAHISRTDHERSTFCVLGDDHIDGVHRSLAAIGTSVKLLGKISPIGDLATAINLMTITASSQAGEEVKGAATRDPAGPIIKALADLALS